MTDENGRVTQPDLGPATDLVAMTADRDRWRALCEELKTDLIAMTKALAAERSGMVLRSRLHGIRHSLLRLDSELGRIIDEK
jgi:hypothetical protein